MPCYLPKVTLEPAEVPLGLVLAGVVMRRQAASGMRSWPDVLCKEEWPGK